MTRTEPPPVTVTVPVYGDAPHLRTALRSVQAQDYDGHIEILVVDDGSPVEVEPRFRDEFPSVRWLRQSNGGLCAARKTGSEQASHDLIAYLDDDDVFHPSKIRRQVQVLQERPDLGICCTDLGAPDALEAPESGLLHTRGIHHYGLPLDSMDPAPSYVIPRRAILEFALDELPFFVQCSLVRRSALESMGGWNPDVGNFDSHDFCVRANWAHDIAFLDAPLIGLRRGHGTNLSADTVRARYVEALCLCRAFRAFSKPLAMATGAAVERRMDTAARILCEHGHYGEASDLYHRIRKQHGFSVRAALQAVRVRAGSIFRRRAHRGPTV